MWRRQFSFYALYCLVMMSSVYLYVAIDTLDSRTELKKKRIDFVIQNINEKTNLWCFAQENERKNVSE